MRERTARKGELNHELQQIMKRCFDRTGSALEAVPLIQAELKRLSKHWNVREVIVNYDSELVPVGGDDWEVTGKYSSFVESIRVEAYRIRPNRTLGEHKVCLVHWPDGAHPAYEENPTMSSMIDDSYVLLSVHRDTGKVLGWKQRTRRA